MREFGYSVYIKLLAQPIAAALTGPLDVKQGSPSRHADPAPTLGITAPQSVADFASHRPPHECSAIRQQITKERAFTRRRSQRTRPGRRPRLHPP
jgi:hypothetical protein